MMGEPLEIFSSMNTKSRRPSNRFLPRYYKKTNKGRVAELREITNVFVGISDPDSERKVASGGKSN
jgi:hypothetical protein